MRTMIREAARPVIRMAGYAVYMIALVSCTVNYEDAQILEELTQSTPELEIIEPKYTFVRNNARTMQVSAEKSELFAMHNEQRFVNVAFIELDKNNMALNSGSADSAIYFIGSGNFQLDGNVIFQSIEQEATVMAPYLFWNNQEEQLVGREEDVVTVNRPSGTSIQGTYLRADLSNRIMELDNAKGVIFSNDAKSITLR